MARRDYEDDQMNTLADCRRQGRSLDRQPIIGPAASETARGLSGGLIHVYV